MKNWFLHGLQTITNKNFNKVESWLLKRRTFTIRVDCCVCVRSGILNPFPHTTILQQTTLNVFCQKIENLHNWIDNRWQKVENIVAKGEIACFLQFLLLSLCFIKSRLLQRRQKVSIWGKGLSFHFHSTRGLDNGVWTELSKLLSYFPTKHYVMVKVTS